MPITQQICSRCSKEISDPAKTIPQPVEKAPVCDDCLKHYRVVSVSKEISNYFDPDGDFIYKMSIALTDTSLDFHGAVGEADSYSPDGVAHKVYFYNGQWHADIITSSLAEFEEMYNNTRYWQTQKPYYDQTTMKIQQPTSCLSNAGPQPSTGKQKRMELLKRKAPETSDDQ